MCSFCAIYAQNTVTDSHNHAQEQRSRGIEWRNSYVTNANPVYSAPKECASPPRIITALRKAALTSNPARHPIWRTADRFHAINHQRLPKERAMNEHRARAVNAICACIADRLNIVTGKVFMTLAQISDSCGLTTYNKDKTPCYSRASRAINEHLEAIGAIHCERVWDETTGSWIPNLIWVSELFFTLIGYEYGKYEAAQQQQLAWENKGLKEKGEPAISLTEARRRAKVKHIQTAFEVRTKKRAFKTQLRQARKLAAMEKQKAQAKILNDLVKLYSQDELAAMGHVELKRQVEHRYAAMRKLATAPPH
ncbi:replication associated protein RepA1 [Salmonella enterica]|uniref:Replication initiation protein n=1 Tax=Salmonella diarizonae TaxID=59204 RepID=A0A635JC95_SALDZ|nr:replication associated protein RepA1 [Salmonella enterica]EDH7458056.1 replication associated protein RepA1 [Salmonella enterica subsp. diarizonae]